jgi:hypothetical protein
MAKRVRAEQSSYAKMLFYGKPGSTKTRTVGSAALDKRMAPVLMLDIGGNPLSIRDYPVQPDIIQIDEMADLNPVYSWLLAGQPQDRYAEKMELTPGYKTVIVDGITDLQRYSFAQVVGNMKKLPGDIPIATQIQHHQGVLAQMTNFARLFFKLEMHVLVTALEKEVMDPNGITMYGPLLTGQAPGEVSVYPYVVSRLVHRAKIDKREARDSKLPEDPNGQTISVAFFTPSARIMAKDQYGIGVPWMVDPTMTKMLDLAAASVEEKRAAMAAALDIDLG